MTLVLAPVLATVMAMSAGGLSAQPTASVQASPAPTTPIEPAATTTIIGAPDAPVRSTLKPTPGAGDGTRPRQRLVTVFGTEECPKPTSADEIVVCARLPDSEIYRIPKQLRAANNARVSPFQANRNLLLGDSSGGAGGAIGSCSVIGGSGFVGCTKNDVDAWARDRTTRMGATEEVPPQ
ncbi:hypothetical protein [Sandarakinorhabdus sp. DWP1-3-1]|uniref:hypothetical protein n=1 Tax=Sandarakinorhabdus sp. DWP1-3-1 TaxID=2804627 RepID=UPI003CE6820F